MLPLFINFLFYADHMPNVEVKFVAEETGLK